MKPGEPKKGGGGGMFTWGRIDDTSKNYDPIVEDRDDPNYSSEVSFDVETSIQSIHSSPFKPVHPSSTPLLLTPEYWEFDEIELKKETRVKVDQVFTEGTYSSFISWIRSLGRNKLHSSIFARTVQVALEKAETDYEVAWGLVDLLYSAKLFSARELRRGFDRLYRQIPDIMTDVPNAPEVVLELLNKIILEGTLSPFAVLRVPTNVLNLGRGLYVLREIKSGEVVLADLTESLQNTKEKIIELIKEYYATGVSEGVAEYVKAQKWFGSLVVRKAVELALDRSNQEKELCSRLLAEISGYCSPEALLEGFDDILWNSGELVIDVPGAVEIISKFLARAIVDDSLPTNYIQEAEILNDSKVEVSILLNAYNLLKPKEAFTSLESVWGPQTGSIDDYKALFKALIQEFFDSKDLQNAEDCLKEMPCRHYMHEFVKKVIEVVMDKSPAEEILVIELLKRAHIKGIITPDQLEKGLNRVEQNLPQLSLDVPKASEILSKFRAELFKP